MQTDIVRPPFQHREVEWPIEVLGEERKVLGRKLVLQGLRSSRDDRAFAAENDGDEVSEGLPRPRSRLDDQVLSGDDGRFDGGSHLLLTLAAFTAAIEVAHEALERGYRR